MKHWLIKSEPDCFSIDDLRASPRQTGAWDGVRNYQARNMLRDEMKVGDLAFFYHSSCSPPGIVGVVEIVKAGYPDYTAWDLDSDHYDPKSTKEKPLWYMVDVKLVKKFKTMLSLEELKKHSSLKDMVILRKGNRLSVTPVTAAEFKVIKGLAD